MLLTGGGLPLPHIFWPLLLLCSQMPSSLSSALLFSLLTGCASQGVGFSLTLLDAAKYPMARCLDGSQPGFYFQPGYGSGANSWLVHTQGGGWCVNDNDCLGRSKSALGSSSSWGKGGCPNPSSPVCYADGGDSGMLSNSSDVNPLLYNWNKVFIGECLAYTYCILSFLSLGNPYPRFLTFSIPWEP